MIAVMCSNCTRRAPFSACKEEDKDITEASPPLPDCPVFSAEGKESGWSGSVTTVHVLCVRYWR